jgi:hypothetical protein
MTHSAFLGDGDVVVAFVPLTERSSIDLDNSTLDEGVGADELVVGGIVDYADDTSLAGGVFGGPGKVAGLETECAVLEVSTTHTDSAYSLGTELGVCGLTTELKLSLLAD